MKSVLKLLLDTNLPLLNEEIKTTKLVLIK